MGHLARIWNLNLSGTLDKQAKFPRVGTLDENLELDMVEHNKRCFCEMGHSVNTETDYEVILNKRTHV